MFKKDAKLAVILSAPTLSGGDKSQIVQELQKHAGGGGGDTVRNFLRTLAENNRLGILQGVCEKFAVLMGAARGEVELVVTSAAVSVDMCACLGGRGGGFGKGPGGGGGGVSE